jgi:hypothetical protein
LRAEQTGTTAGEIYLFGMLHQAVVAGGGMALAKSKNVRGGGVEFEFAKVKLWYETMKQEPAIQKVLAGESAIGKLNPYFIDTPTFNAKHGIEDDSGYGVANGYGTVSPSPLASASRLPHF